MRVARSDLRGPRRSNAPGLPGEKRLRGRRSFVPLVIGTSFLGHRPILRVSVRPGQPHEGMDEHISALHAAARDLLTRQPEPGTPVPNTIWIDIRVGPNSGPVPQARIDAECWTATYICGKGATGYIHCTVDVCMEVGDITTG